MITRWLHSWLEHRYLPWHLALLALLIGGVAVALVVAVLAPLPPPAGRAV